MEAWREELYHHGIKGQKWYVRRFQNEDGTLTDAGKRRLLKFQKRSDEAKESTNIYYTNASVYGNKARDQSIKKRDRTNIAKAGAWQYEEGLRKDKEYQKYQKKMAELGQMSAKDPFVKSRAMAGEHYVAKNKGKYVAQKVGSEAVGWTMAVGMAMINPAGIGMGYSPHVNRYELKK